MRNCVRAEKRGAHKSVDEPFGNLSERNGRVKGRKRKEGRIPTRFVCSLRLIGIILTHATNDDGFDRTGGIACLPPSKPGQG